MWVDKYKAYLDIKCADCGKELEAELAQSVSTGSNNETITAAPCECQQERIHELEEEIVNLNEEDNDG